MKGIVRQFESVRLQDRVSRSAPYRASSLAERDLAAAVLLLRDTKKGLKGSSTVIHHARLSSLVSAGGRVVAIFAREVLKQGKVFCGGAQQESSPFQSTLSSFLRNFSLVANQSIKIQGLKPKFTQAAPSSLQMVRTWQRKAVCEEEEFGLIQRKLRSPRTFFVFVNSFWLRSSAPPPPRDMSTKFSLCRTKSCTGG